MPLQGIFANTFSLVYRVLLVLLNGLTQWSLCQSAAKKQQVAGLFSPFEAIFSTEKELIQ
jgi:hypothetical protein